MIEVGGGVQALFFFQCVRLLSRYLQGLTRHRTYQDFDVGLLASRLRRKNSFQSPQSQMLEIEHRALSMLSKCFSTEPRP